MSSMKGAGMKSLRIEVAEGAMNEGDKIAAQQSGIFVRRDQRRWGRLT